MPRRSRLLAVFVAAVMAGLFALTPTASAAAAPSALPYVKDNATQPVYSYQNAIRESVWLPIPFDSDRDGKQDRVRLDIVRPREAAAAGVKVPMIFEASPYWSCCARGSKKQVKEYGSDGNLTLMPAFYDNYFVPRGYAFGGLDLTGTNKSGGCPDVGGPAEIAAGKAVVDWLNGRVPGYGLDGNLKKADWSSGRAGMVGKSWDGTIPNGVAATGVPGLETIVPVSAISSWYDYERFGGVLRSPGYVDYLANYVNGRPKGVCDASIAADQAASDDSTGNYNAFWAARDYRPSANKVRASVFVIHGINDLNVTTSQFATWWDDLAARGVPRKIWLTQEGHIDPFEIRRAQWVDTVHRWFDYWLQKLPNGIMSEPMASIERPSGDWTTASTWPAPGAVDRPVFLGSGGGTTGTLGGGISAAVRTITDDPTLTESTGVANPNQPLGSRAVFLSGTLTHDLRISGIPRANLRVKVNKPTTELTVKLVDYGEQHRVDYLSTENPGSGVHYLSTESCWGESTAIDTACFNDDAEDFVDSDVDVLTRGYRDAAHYLSLRTVTPLQPGRWYNVPVSLDAYETVVKAGHVLGMVVTASDNEATSPTSTGATIQLSLAGSYLLLPSTSSLPFVAQPPQVRTTAKPESLSAAIRHDRFQVPWS
ncbi:Xaa-Pro dipeptidyl-peptidase [Fodinicola feengrottensis]|uniref:Xaa-Pro dipeptidyl-peptidase n=1 Tax=Fodinicola feengrottensis TaxID=435914 RepID=A0ABN2J5X0_9ACTN|nr:Xaa-Pro dipeptidyl-peptidase [Fodinicola feengrottensis]